MAPLYLGGVGLFGGEGGQQRVPAVDGGFSLEDVLVEVPVEGGQSGGVGGDGGTQATSDAEGFGDHAEFAVDDLLNR